MILLISRTCQALYRFKFVNVHVFQPLFEYILCYLWLSWKRKNRDFSTFEKGSSDSYERASRMKGEGCQAERDDTWRRGKGSFYHRDVMQSLKLLLISKETFKRSHNGNQRSCKNCSLFSERTIAKSWIVP